jgi:Protein of unknown function (DUF 659)
VIKSVETYLFRHILDEQSSLQFAPDKSPDIKHWRIANFSLVIPKFGSFYLGNECVKDKSLNSQFLAEWFFQMIKQYCSDSKRISSLSTDTCSAMQKTWAGLKEHLLLKHALLIPCGSHGLQLLIKDVLELKLLDFRHRPL